ncbi:SLAM family member 5-like isoform X2 [Ochotona curzoniae]|uniref:SLAM family member 5-like isoform X2 n=1 Tax=Ochotona curzoniae TaxID=130825 RepID=UPI001B34E0EA|nr:SLAM family member 5-like isoform X2 [Ochotona curzoniae]
MGCCLGTPVLRWASGFLVCLSLLLRISHTLANSPEAQGSGVTDPGGVHPAVKRMRGDSVWFPAILKSGEILEEITWGIGSESAYTNFLRVNSGPDSPKWLGLQDKFKGRVHVPNMTSLMIESLIPQDSGQYRVQAMHTGGLSYNQVFYLSVYEPVPAPHLMASSTSLMSGWCNVTLECRVTEAMEDLNVTWESTGLNEELKCGGTLGRAPISWTLDVSLPMSQPNASLSCVVSNPVDQKNATLELGDICIQSAALKEDHGADDDDIDYAQLAQQETQGGEKGRDEQHLEEKESVMTIYSKVHNTGQLMKII